MRTTQYVRQLRAIAAADAGGIRERWMYGLRLLRDPEVMSSTRSLRHGVADQLVAVAKANGLSLSAREIQRCIQCARAYPTEAQIRQALADFATWFELHSAGFPAYGAPEGEPPADHRDASERARDARRQLVRRADEEDQGTLFPLDRYEPTATPLKELRDYAHEMRALTTRFVSRDAKRFAYLDRLVAAAGGDLSMSWQEAHERLGADAIDLMTSGRAGAVSARDSALLPARGGGS
jgi:hypothetical protein